MYSTWKKRILFGKILIALEKELQEVTDKLNEVEIEYVLIREKSWRCKTTILINMLLC